MSDISTLLADTPKPWLNIRVNNETVDDTITADNINVSGTLTVPGILSVGQLVAQNVKTKDVQLVFNTSSDMGVDLQITNPISRVSYLIQPDQVNNTYMVHQTAPLEIFNKTIGNTNTIDVSTISADEVNTNDLFLKTPSSGSNGVHVQIPNTGTITTYIIPTGETPFTQIMHQTAPLVVSNKTFDASNAWSSKPFFMSNIAVSPNPSGGNIFITVSQMINSSLIIFDKSNIANKLFLPNPADIINALLNPFDGMTWEFKIINQSIGDAWAINTPLPAGWGNYIGNVQIGIASPGGIDSQKGRSFWIRINSVLSNQLDIIG